MTFQPLCEALEAHFFGGYDLIFGYAYGAVPPLLTSRVPYVPVEIGNASRYRQYRFATRAVARPCLSNGSSHCHHKRRLRIGSACAGSAELFVRTAPRGRRRVSATSARQAHGNQTSPVWLEIFVDRASASSVGCKGERSLFARVCASVRACRARRDLAHCRMGPRHPSRESSR